MQKSNVNGALRLLTNNMSNGILPLLNETKSESEASKSTKSLPRNCYTETNCYTEPARLFVAGNHEITSREGRIQGDPTEMGAYAPGL